MTDKEEQETFSTFKAMKQRLGEMLTFWKASSSLFFPDGIRFIILNQKKQLYLNEEFNKLRLINEHTIIGLGETVDFFQV